MNDFQEQEDTQAIPEDQKPPLESLNTFELDAERERVAKEKLGQAEEIGRLFAKLDIRYGIEGPEQNKKKGVDLKQEGNEMKILENRAKDTTARFRAPPQPQPTQLT